MEISEHGKPLETVREGNVIEGGNLKTDRIIPDCLGFFLIMVMILNALISTH